MSVAAGSPGKTTARHPRLRGVVEWADAALSNGRLPALLISLICGLMLWAFVFSGDFRVETVTIRGLEYGPVEAVEEQALLLDESTFRVQPDAAADRIASLPNVQSVTVDIQFPNSASITIIERTPAINVQVGEDGTLVSSDAHAIAPGFVDGLPVLVLGGGASVQSELDPEIVKGVTAVAAVYGPDALLVWDPEIGLAMEHPDGGTVIFGEPVDIEAKLTVLAAVELQLEDGWTQLDIRVPTRPSYR